MEIYDKVKITNCDHPVGKTFIGKTGVIASIINGNTTKFYRVVFPDGKFNFMSGEFENC